MKTKHVTWFAALLALAAAAAPAQAGRGGNGGGGGGAEEPPAPLVITYLEGGSSQTSSGDLMACSADGSTRMLLLAGSHMRPSWSPDGSRIAFGSTSLGTVGVYAYSLADETTNLVVPLLGDTTKVAWAPASLGLLEYVIAYTDTPIGDTETDIFLASLDGDTINLTQTPGVAERHPTWSPDAGKIAFSRSSSRDTGLPSGYLDDEIVVMDVEVVAGVPTLKNEDVISRRAGSPLRDEDVRQPSWSKGGSKLLVKTGGGSGWHGDIWVIDLAAPTAPTNITGGIAQFTLAACWSTDDTTLVYTGSNDVWQNGGALWTLVLATGSRSEIVGRGRGKTTSYKHHADWQR